MMKNLILFSTYLLFFISILNAQDIQYGSDIQVNTSVAEWSGALPVVTELNSGNLVVCWKKGNISGTIAARIFDNDLNPITDELTLFNLFPYKSKSHPINIKDVTNEEIAICSLTNGDFAMIICNFDTLIGRYYDPLGQDRGISIAANTGGEIGKSINHPSVKSLANGNIIICWSLGQPMGSYEYWQSDGIFGQIFDLNGNAITNIFKINTSNNVHEWSPTVEVLGNSNFIVTWFSGQGYYQSHIYAQIFDSNANKINDQFLVSPDTLGFQTEPHVSKIDMNKFVIFWSDDQGKAIGRIYTNDLQPLEIIYNSYAEWIYEPYALGLENGNIFLAYTYDNDLMTYGLLFDDRGNIIGRDFFICFGNFFANYMRMTKLGNNGFVVCWQELDEEGDDDIFIRYFLNSPLTNTLGIFSLSEPANDQIITTYWNRVDFSWHKAAKNQFCYPFEVMYDLIIDDNVNFNSPIIEPDIIDTTYTMRDLESNNVYYWKVIAKNLAGDSLNCTESYAFIISPLGIDPFNHDKRVTYHLFQNYPNPFNPSTKIRFMIPVAEHTRIDVYTTSGQLIKTLINKKLSEGYYEIEFNAQDLANGTYFYRLQAGKFFDVKKMLLIK